MVLAATAILQSHVRLLSWRWKFGADSESCSTACCAPQDGRETRFPVVLTTQEKAIASAVCLATGQMICGFDLLRTSQGSYVCDVNGWSFVKKSTKYYDDCR